MGGWHLVALVGAAGWFLPSPPPPDTHAIPLCYSPQQLLHLPLFVCLFVFASSFSLR